MNSNKQIKAGAVISYAGIAINIIVSLLYTPWMVRTIGQSNYALYTLASSFISIFMLDFGLSSAASRFVAKYRAECNEDKLNEFIVTIEKLYLLIAGILLVVLFALYFFIGKIYVGLTDEELNTFRQLYIIVAMYSVVSFPSMPFSGIIQAYEKFVQGKLCELFNKLFSVTIIVIALLSGAGVTAVVSCNVISGLITIVLKFLVIRKNVGIKVHNVKIRWSFLKEIAGFSIWTTVISLAQRCFFSLAPTILGIVSNSTEIAVFAPANSLEGYFYTFASAVNGLFLATISRYIAQKEENKILSLMIKVGRYQLALMGLIFVGFICVGRDFMICWMGEDYVKAWPCAVLLFIPDILLFSQQIANTTAIAMNKVRQQSYGYIGAAIICVCISMPASSLWGAIGASMAIAVAYLFLFIYLNIFVYKKGLNLDIGLFFKQCYGGLGLPIIGSCVICLFLTRALPFDVGWGSVLAKAVLVVIIYAVVVSIFLNKEEKLMIRNLILGIKNRMVRNNHVGGSE